MTRLGVLVAAAALASAFTATSAVAKGASEATITGPGLGDGITLAGEGQLGGERLMQLAEATGFFPALFVTTPNPMRPARPEGELGPRYTIAYQLPGPEGQLDELRQDLYPYAKPDPVTYVKPGEPYWATEQTVGGWYVAGSTLKEQLVALGLPRLPPTDDGGSDMPWPVLGGGVLIVVALVGLTLFLVRTRRPRPATV
jgi:hypothetical protein